MDSPQDRTECIGNRIAMTLVRRAAVWVACLALPGPALGDDHNTGWYFSRANCLTANESITWKIDLTPTALEAVVGQVVPGTGFSGLGIPAYRRTTSRHYHRHRSGKDHSHQSSLHLEWTWRAHAGSFPLPEAFPYVAIVVRYRVVWEDWVFGTPLIVVPYIVAIIDPAPWTVYGTHYEITSAGGALTTSYSYATGCNWGDTFNSM